MAVTVLRLESLFTGIQAPAVAPTLPILRDEINANVTITTFCEDVQWNKPLAPREIAIIFTSAPPGPEITELDTVVIPAHTGNGADLVPDTTTATTATRTGIRNGAVLSAAGTTFTLTDGDGFTVDNFTNPDTPDPVPTVWSGITSVTIIDILTTEFTIIALDSAGNPLQLSTFTAPDFRDKILVGLIQHPGGTVLTAANTQVDLHEDGMSAFRDLMQIIGLLNDSGNVYSKSTIAALGLNVTAGTMFFPGIGRDGTVSGFKDPNREAQSAATDLTFVYVRGDGAGGITVENATETNINVTELDDGAGGKVSMTGSRWKIDLISRNLKGPTWVEFGTVEFSTREAAIAAVSSQPTLLGTTFLTRFGLVVQRNAADLTILNAEFVEILHAGTSSTGSSGGDVFGPGGSVVVAGELTQFDDASGQLIGGTGIQANTLLFAGTPQFGEGCRAESSSPTVVKLTAGSLFSSVGFLPISLATFVGIDTAVTGVNGLDTGTLAARTWYAGYLIADSTGVNASAGLISTSFTAPTLPGTHDLFRRCFALFTDDVPGFRDFIQTGNGARRLYQYRDDVQGPDQAILRQGGATAFVNLDAAEVTPPATVTRRVARLTVINESAGVDAFIRAAVNPETRGPHVVPPGNSQRIDLRLDNTTTNIQYGHSAAGGQLTVFVEGYEEQLEDDL